MTQEDRRFAQNGINFFSLWIARIGGIVAFIGAIKFALSIKADDARDQLNAVLIMVSGFMIRAAVQNLGIFSLSTTNANTIFSSVMTFISTWTRRVGALGALIGAIMFAFAIKMQSECSTHMQLSDTFTILPDATKTSSGCG